MNRKNDKQPLPLLGLDLEVKLTEFEAPLFSLLLSLSCFKEVKLLKAEASLILLLLRKCKKKLPIKCQIVSKSSKLLKNNLEKNFNKIF